MSLIKIIRNDIEANRNNYKMMIFIIFFRISVFIRKSNFIVRFLLFWIRFMYKLIFQWGLGIDFPDNLKVGTPIIIFHGTALIVNSESIIKNNVTLRHSTTIGNKKDGSGSPVIGNNVDIGANSVIIGQIEIGDNAIIGAGSVVVHDIPPNVVVAGNPAKIIRYLNK